MKKPPEVKTLTEAIANGVITVVDPTQPIANFVENLIYYGSIMFNIMELTGSYKEVTLLLPAKTFFDPLTSDQPFLSIITKSVTTTPGLGARHIYVIISPPRVILKNIGLLREKLLTQKLTECKRLNSFFVDFIYELSKQLQEREGEETLLESLESLEDDFYKGRLAQSAPRTMTKLKKQILGRLNGTTS